MKYLLLAFLFCTLECGAATGLCEDVSASSDEESGVAVQRGTTRYAKLELSDESVQREELRFDADHYRAHFDGTGGSQFTRFGSPEELIKWTQKNLPKTLTFDKDPTNSENKTRRIEITLTVPGDPVGTKGIVSREEALRLAHESGQSLELIPRRVSTEQPRLDAEGKPVAKRDATGKVLLQDVPQLDGSIKKVPQWEMIEISYVAGEVAGRKGYWLPEGRWDSSIEPGYFMHPLKADGTPRNAQHKFEANVWQLKSGQTPTNEITLVIEQKSDGQGGRVPVVMAMFPGPNANRIPVFERRPGSDGAEERGYSWGANPDADFWDGHVLLK